MHTSHTILAELAHQELEVLSELVTVLQEEQSQLVGTSIDMLEQIVPKKVTLVSKMEQLAMSRYTELGKAGFQPDETGMKTWLDSIKDAPGAIIIENEWNDLLSITHKAKELNRINGLLISSHMQRNQQALNILHAHASNSTYGPDGQPKHHRVNPHSIAAG